MQPQSPIGDGVHTAPHSETGADAGLRIAARPQQQSSSSSKRRRASRHTTAPPDSASRCAPRLHIPMRVGLAITTRRHAPLSAHLCSSTADRATHDLLHPLPHHRRRPALVYDGVRLSTSVSASCASAPTSDLVAFLSVTSISAVKDFHVRATWTAVSFGIAFCRTTATRTSTSKASQVERDKTALTSIGHGVAIVSSCPPSAFQISPRDLCS